MTNEQLMLNPAKAVCFSGHRPSKLGGYHGPKDLKIQSGIHQKLYELVNRALDSGTTHFIQGGALGVDQIAAEVCIRIKREGRKLVLITAKPFPSQNSKWPQQAQERYLNILNNSDYVVTVSQDPFTNAKMWKRNAWMVDNSSNVIAVYSGQSGGTHHCVEYARKAGKGVCVINPFTLEERWEVNQHV